ncbi:enoyl-CoA hydratase/isomerase family protein [Polaromonas sp. C04]|uniref:enoyl-CoA hydratase/isomerase family protein n=1 Tax=Polaromonas sp. C04 TaxID=1945857 RepID=UPI0009855FFD|nr:enoyl-CoA hydratase/isomerase family protein [Polaromonas sp. C04]OOG53089.1 3-hydroxybutyryl-CoA dehydratase [Polaromonas sp. C04]
MSINAGQLPHLSVQGPVATLRLNRPELANRLEVEDLKAVQQLLARVNSNQNIRVLRITATGRHFCSGFDTRKISGDDAGTLFEATAQALEQVRPLTIAAINGGIYGGATDLALACDFRVGVQSANMFVPVAEIGLHFYGSGLERYVSRLGLTVAKRVLLAGERLDASQMLSCGFLDKMVGDMQELQAEVDRFSSHLASMAPLAVQAMKRHLNRFARGALDMNTLKDDIHRVQTSADLLEGVKAKAEKRKPVFIGA